MHDLPNEAFFATLWNFYVKVPAKHTQDDYVRTGVLDSLTEKEEIEQKDESND